MNETTLSDFERNGVDIKVRETCQHCNGTGKGMTDAEAVERAVSHNRAASQCHTPNYLTAADFVGCSKCNGKGKRERWMPVEEVLTLTPEQVAKFAELVAEAEREACAKTARKVPDVSEDYARSEAYVKIDHFLRDALDAVDYAEYSAALDLIFK